MAIQISEDEYNKSLFEFRFCLNGCLVLSKGDQIPTTHSLKMKLSAQWKIDEASWKITPLEKCSCNLDLKFVTVESMVFARGTLSL